MWYMFYYSFGSVQSMTRSDNGYLLDKWFSEARSVFGKEKGSARNGFGKQNKLTLRVFNHLVS